MAKPSFNTLTGRSVRVKVVDVGANPIDSAPPYADLLRAGDADVVGFEPNPNALAKLDALKGPNETYLPHALGDGRRHTLHICAASGMTSLLEPNSTVLNLFHGFPVWAQVLGTEKLKTLRMDDIAETKGVDLIKIDIQGAELMVFRSATDRLADALVVHTEVEFLQMYTGQPLFGDVEKFLRSQGFVFHQFLEINKRTIQPLLVNNNVYAGLSQWLYADAVFIRDFSRLDLLTDERLLKLAALMHECYLSYDLVYRLLIEYDTRTGDGLAETYLTNLKSTAASA